jgi:hypothetical protein
VSQEQQRVIASLSSGHDGWKPYAPSSRRFLSADQPLHRPKR